MESIRQYIVTVCAAAMICGIVRHLAEKKSPAGELIHMLCGIFLTVTAVSPLLKIQIRDISSLIQDFQQEGEMIATQAEQQSVEDRNEIITSAAKAYIMDKAAALNAELEVEIILSEETVAVPCGAILRGNVSPYAKVRLMEILESDLGIAKEAQQWKT